VNSKFAWTISLGLGNCPVMASLSLASCSGSWTCDALSLTYGVSDVLREFSHSILCSLDRVDALIADLTGDLLVAA
jgi:hypothetical protein